MAIKISQGFKRTSKEPIDETLTLTLAQMKSIDEASLPDKYFTICQDNGKLYLYNKSNTVDPATGKFRLLEGGGGTGSADWGNIGGTITNQTDLVYFVPTVDVIGVDVTFKNSKNDNDEDELRVKSVNDGLEWYYYNDGGVRQYGKTLASKDYVDSKEPDAITNQDIDNIIFGE